MSSEVKRHNSDIDKFGAVRAYESEHGLWVKHADYAALEAECKRLRDAERERWMEAQRHLL